MTRSNDRQRQLTYLFERQHGRCHICGGPAVLDFKGGSIGRAQSAVRFRLGGGRYGDPGSVRKRVMAHRGCAQERADQITREQPIEELRRRSQREGDVFFYNDAGLTSESLGSIDEKSPQAAS